MKKVYSISKIDEVADWILQNLHYKTVLFKGEMGAGKTTLIKAICRKLGVTDTISSPTFSLVNEYEGENTRIYHFDFYRIKDSSEAFQIGFEEYLDNDAYKFIEWPDKVMELLPIHVDIIKIELSVNKDSRKLVLSSKE